jgi:hypothetical protein
MPVDRVTDKRHPFFSSDLLQFPLQECNVSFMKCKFQYVIIITKRFTERSRVSWPRGIECCHQWLPPTVLETLHDCLMAAGSRRPSHTA